MPSPSGYQNRGGLLGQAAGNNLYAYKYRSLQTFRQTFSSHLYGTLETAIKLAVGLGTKEAIAAARTFLTSVDFASRNNMLLLGNAWARAGAIGQQAMLNEYDAMEIRGGHGSYTISRGDRLSGHLRPALASSDFYVASVEGIRFGNLGVLNAHASHWARLNFGAGSRGEAGAAVFGRGQTRYQSFALAEPTIEGLDRRAATFAEEVVQSGIGSFGPRPAFTMPAGNWITDGGEYVKPAGVNPSIDQFLPGASKGPHHADYRPLFMKDRPTQGITPRRFIDVGVRAMVLAFGDQLAHVVAQWEKLPEGPIHRAEQAGFVTVQTDAAWKNATFGSIPYG